MTLQETLRAFAAKTTTVDGVMRAIMNYDAWQAPVLYASEVLKTDYFERIAMWGNGQSVLPRGELCLFTDDAAANLFLEKHGIAGPFATPLLGCKLFKNLPDNLLAVRVNPGSPPSEGWYIQQGGFDLTRMWAKAVEVEWMLSHGDEGFLTALLGFEAFAVIVLPNGAIATAVGAAGMKNPGMIFTTPDCAEVVMREAGDAVAGAKLGYLSGRELFRRFDRFGVDGFLLNPRGPGATHVLSTEACAALVSYVKDEDQLSNTGPV